jgi:hypothetical protein
MDSSFLEDTLYRAISRTFILAVALRVGKKKGGGSRLSIFHIPAIGPLIHSSIPVPSYPIIFGFSIPSSGIQNKTRYPHPPNLMGLCSSIQYSQLNSIQSMQGTRQLSWWVASYTRTRVPEYHIERGMEGGLPDIEAFLREG